MESADGIYITFHMCVYIMCVTIIIKGKEAITLKRSEGRCGRGWREGTWEGLEGGKGAESDVIIL